MRQRILTTFGAALVAAALAAAPAEAKPGNGNGHGPGHGQGHAKGRPGKGVSVLEATATDADAAGRVHAKHFPAVGKRAERSWLGFRLRGLTADASYSLWIDDPATADDTALVEVTGVTFTANAEGAENLRLDTKRGDTLPFGATLAELAGLSLEVRDGDGNAVLTGTLPAVQ